MIFKYIYCVGEGDVYYAGNHAHQFGITNSSDCVTVFHYVSGLKNIVDGAFGWDDSAAFYDCMIVLGCCLHF